MVKNAPELIRRGQPRVTWAVQEVWLTQLRLGLTSPPQISFSLKPPDTICSQTHTLSRAHAHTHAIHSMQIADFENSKCLPRWKVWLIFSPLRGSKPEWVTANGFCASLHMCVNGNLASLYLHTPLACLQTLVCNLGPCHWHNKEQCALHHYSLNLVLNLFLGNELYFKYNFHNC